ncbi:MAG: TonB-dependent receptor [Pseudomonadota bacterium]
MTALLCAGLLALAPPARAATQVDPFQEPDAADAFQVEERMVTVASRYAQTASQAPSIVTVISDREIRERGFQTISDMLASLPGVYLSMAPEGRSLAWFRGVVGADNNKFLLLIDGVPWYDGVYTHAWIDEYVPLENVRQVEIIKGPGSAIYGTNAFSGVVNVVTYGAGELGGGFVRLSGGSHARHSAAFVMGDSVPLPRDQRLGISGMVRFLDTDGDGLDLTPKGERNISGTQPRRAMNASMRVQTDHLDLSLAAVDYRHSYYTQPQNDALDVLLQNVEDFNLAYRDQFFQARYRFDLSRDLSLTPYLYLQHYDDPGSYAWFSDPETTYDPETDSYSTAWKTTLVETAKESTRSGVGVETQLRPGANHVIVGGLGWEYTRALELEDLTFTDLTGESTPSFFLDPAYPDHTWDAFAFAQETWTALYWLEFTGGLRVDLHSTAGFHPSPRVGVLLVPTSNTVVKLLYGSAFRAPTVREAYVATDKDEEGHNAWTAGNPGLNYERIDTVEAEVLATPIRQLDLRAAVFYSSVGDEIDKREVDEPDPDLGDAYYDNFAGSDILGGEAEATLHLDWLDLGASWALTQAHDRATDRQQYEFPPNMGHLRATVRPVEALRVSLLADHYGRRPRKEWSPDAGLPDGPPFTLLHAALATDLLASGRVRADLSVRNLLDTDYATLIYRDDANEVKNDAAKYPNDLTGPGRSIVVGIEGEF